MAGSMIRVNYNIYKDGMVADKTYTLINHMEASIVVGQAIDLIRQVSEGILTAEQAMNILTNTVNDNIDDLE